MNPLDDSVANLWTEELSRMNLDTESSQNGVVVETELSGLPPPPPSLGGTEDEPLPPPPPDELDAFPSAPPITNPDDTLPDLPVDVTEPGTDTLPDLPVDVTEPDTASLHRSGGPDPGTAAVPAVTGISHAENEITSDPFAVTAAFPRRQFEIAPVPAEQMNSESPDGHDYRLTPGLTPVYNMEPSISDKEILEHFDSMADYIDTGGKTSGAPPAYTPFATRSEPVVQEPNPQRPFASQSQPVGSSEPAIPNQYSPMLVSVDEDNGDDLPAPELDSDDSDVAAAEQEYRRLGAVSAAGRKKKISTRERLTFGSIVCNVIYNILLFVSLIATFLGYMMYEWIETTVEDMEKANIYVSANVPGFKSVSCGLTTYCIDAAGTVSECSIPWPRYGEKIYEEPIEAPYFYWKIAAGLFIGAMFLLAFAWIYTFLACFGCFKTKIQKCCNYSVIFAGCCMIGGLCLFAYSFGDLAVAKCISPSPNATLTSDPPCNRWLAQLPSETIEGPGNAACRICPPNVDAFTMSTSCGFGYGAYVAAGATLLVFISTVCGNKVTPRRQRSRVKKIKRKGQFVRKQESTV